jgi:hypothetical protein
MVRFSTGGASQQHQQATDPTFAVAVTGEEVCSGAVSQTSPCEYLYAKAQVDKIDRLQQEMTELKGLIMKLLAHQQSLHSPPSQQEASPSNTQHESQKRTKKLVKAK